MICDLRTILDGWEYEPGRISVRKIIGRSGNEKVQTRIDMGVLQIELDGRPDGQRPKGHESYLEYLLEQHTRHVQIYGDDGDFVLSSEDCHELRHEAYLYYQRYLSLFVLEDYERVVRDTSRNLQASDLCERYAAAREDRIALAAQRPYVLMMNARARTCHALRCENPEAALAAVEAGIEGLAALLEVAPNEDDSSQGELRILKELRREVLAKMPPETPARLQWELRRPSSGRITSGPPRCGMPWPPGKSRPTLPDDISVIDPGRAAVPVDAARGPA
jgi:hypothetical protein